MGSFTASFLILSLPIFQITNLNSSVKSTLASIKSRFLDDNNMYGMGTWHWNALSFILFLSVSLLAQRSGILHVQHLSKPPQDLRKRIAFVIRTLVQHVKQWSSRHCILEHKLRPQYSITHAGRSLPERKRFNHLPTNPVRSVSSVAAVLAKHVVNAAQREKWESGGRVINTNTRNYSP